MRIALLATTLLFMVLTCETALACNCRVLSPAESFNNADVVFEGELIRVATLPTSSSFSFASTFKVTRSLKGSAGTFVSIFGDGSECDATYEPGFVYRIYAKEADGMLTNGTCAGNSIVGVASNTEGMFVSRSFSYAPPPYWRSFLMSTLQICGLGVLLGSGVFVWRRYFMKLT
jgi:hypothetical protein